MSVLDSFLNDKDDRLKNKQIKKAPFGWIGGKMYLAQQLNEIMPVKETFVDVFGGSGVVLLNRTKSMREVFNDRNSGITDFYITLQEDYQWLIDKVNNTVFSKEMFYHYIDDWKKIKTRRERAFAWYYSIRCSWAGKGLVFATSRVKVSSKNLYNNLKLFPEIHRRLKGVIIENNSYGELMDFYDSPKTVFYCDPPYMNCDQSCYEFNINHEAFLNKVFEMEGYVAVSGFDSNLYMSYDWTEIIPLSMRYNMRRDSEEKHNQERQELLFIK
jgi:DNA adenine methylase